MHVEKPNKTIDFPAMEKDILALWHQENTFQKSIDQRPADKLYHFYDGPPFATGLPHFGHFVPGSVKDAFCRYATMKGFRAQRRFGWDCHGVPVELLVQKELGLNGKVDIERFGIGAFNKACRESVVRYTKEWRDYVQKLGRWVDMDNDYRTMDLPFMESVWAVFKKLWEKGLIYEGQFVVSYSTALGTTLSNFEATLDYRDIQDPSLTVRAKLTGAHTGKSLLVWTTTPWTLPANVAVAIDGKGTYAEIIDKNTGEHLYLLKSRLESYWPESASYQLVREFLGHELHGVRYEPFFSGLAHKNAATAFTVYETDYVLHDTGTGAVHTAPAFGEDDFAAAKQYQLPVVDHLDLNGKYLDGSLPELTGLDFKAGDKIIIAHLKKQGFVFKHETFVHSYPHCYRSGVPLMYRVVPSWFVKIEEHRELLSRVNDQIHWVPEHIQHGRFGKWLANARDWNIGRSRYWGNPLPVWKDNDTGEIVCIGSVAELQQYTDQKITDLHMECIDHIQIPSRKNPGRFLKRVPFVLDCWFESGSMPYAQNHYMFNPEENFLSQFPADFICEGIDQTRGWFYTLTLLSSLLFQKPAFKNVIVNGLVLAEDGKKMSKSLKNFPDPMHTLSQFGADSVRLFLLGSPATAAEEVRFSTEGVKESTRRILLPLWNAYSFFATYASLDAFDPQAHRQTSTDDLDMWIHLRQNQLLKLVNDNMQAYEIAPVVPAIMAFLDDLNNWYIRRSRRRFWSGDKAAYTTLYDVLLLTTQILAPFAPFAAEYFFGKLALTEDLKALGSVHLCLLPTAQETSKQDQELLQDVAVARQVVELGRTIRVTHKIKNKQPLQLLTVGVLSEETAARILKMQAVICQELNVKGVQVTRDPSALAQISVKPNFKVLGKTMGDRMKAFQEALTHLPTSEALRALQGLSICVEGETFTAEQVVVALRPSGHHLVATENDVVAALDPHITPELKLEGIARELISLVQKARKAAQFDVSDRIQLCIVCREDLLQAIFKNQAEIEEETLSTIVPTLPTASYTTTVDCEGEQVQLLLNKDQIA